MVSLVHLGSSGAPADRALRGRSRRHSNRHRHSFSLSLYLFLCFSVSVSASLTSPCAAKASRKLSSLVLKEMPPTKSFPPSPVLKKRQTIRREAPWLQEAQIPGAETRGGGAAAGVAEDRS